MSLGEKLQGVGDGAKKQELAILDFQNKLLKMPQTCLEYCASIYFNKDSQRI